jgi:hypothetical protein
LICDSPRKAARGDISILKVRIWREPASRFAWSASSRHGVSALISVRRQCVAVSL